MSGRWVDSFDCGPVDRTFPQTRLSRALMLLSQAYHAQEVGTGLAVDDRGLIGQASALIVVERRRLQSSAPPKWREKRELPGEPSLIGAIGSLALAVSAQQHMPGDDLRTMHTVRYLRGSEMHLRELWKAAR